MEGDIIVAIATPPGEGALAIVRLSGPGSVELAASCCSGERRIREAGGMSVLVTSVRGDMETGESSPVIDQVVVAVYRAPKSFTGEDMVEVICHGGHTVPREVLGRFLDAGARPAQPGEFTRRAFCNGKMDLTQAEAVAELIRAGTERAGRAAARRLEGGLKKSVEEIRGQIIELLADIEARLDFADEEIAPLEPGDVSRRLEQVRGEIARYMDTYEQGKLLQHGAMVVLAGAPNAGKSTLFNTLVQRDRVMVSSIPGTTRDAVVEWVNLEGVPVKLVDTAGIRSSGDEIEQESIRRTVDWIKDADLVVVLFDGSGPRNPHDAVVEALDGVAVLPVWSKGDLGLQEQAYAEIAMKPELRISGVTGEGLGKLKALIIKELCGGQSREGADVLISEERQYRALCEAHEALNRVVEADRGGAGFEIIAMELREGTSALGQITGEGIDEAVLDRIFSKFCIGK
jgi:tRNA modification GTPase